MLKIYHMPGSRSARPVWAAEELGLPYELIIKHRNELKLSDFLAINPLGNAPAIQDGEVTMHESCAIVQYLADRYDLENRISPPNASAARGAYLQWLHFAEASFWPLTSAYIDASGRWAGTPPNEAAMAQAREQILSAMNYIDNTLGAQPYIAGDHFTAADIALYWNLMIGKFIRAVDDREMANIQAYGARLQERPAYKKAMVVPEGWVNPPPGSVKTPPIVRASQMSAVS
jgi:glutathione S-transferase